MSGERRNRRDQTGALGPQLGFRVLQLGVIALVVATGAGLAGMGPLSWLHSSKSHTSTIGVGDTPSTRAGGTTTTSTTMLTVERRSYNERDCVTWNQDAGEFPHETHVVPCSTPHLVEMDRSIDLGNRFEHFPDREAWTEIFRDECRSALQDLLAEPVDPYGRYVAAGVQPSEDSWNVGDRTVWCGAAIVSLRPLPAGTYEPFTGEVAHASQTLLAPVGSCWTSNTRYPTPCTTAHEWEVAGYVDVTGSAARPPAESDDAGWRQLLGNRCDVAVTAYLGHPVSGDEGAGWEPIRPESWAAGRRTVECNVARYRNGATIPTVGSLKH